MYRCLVLSVLLLAAIPTNAQNLTEAQKAIVQKRTKQAMSMHMALAVNQRVAILSAAEDLALRMMLEEADRALPRVSPGYATQRDAMQAKIKAAPIDAFDDKTIGNMKDVGRFFLAQFFETYLTLWNALPTKPKARMFKREPTGKDREAMAEYNKPIWAELNKANPQATAETLAEIKAKGAAARRNSFQATQLLRKWNAVILTWLSDRKRAEEKLPHASADPQSLHWYGLRARGNAQPDWLVVVHDPEEFGAHPFDFKLGVRPDGRLVFAAEDGFKQDWRAKAKDEATTIRVALRFHFAELPATKSIWQPEDWLIEGPPFGYQDKPDFTAKGEKPIDKRMIEIELPIGLKEKIAASAMSPRGLLVMHLSLQAVKGDKVLATWESTNHRQSKHGYWIPCWSYATGLAWATAARAALN